MRRSDVSSPLGVVVPVMALEYRRMSVEEYFALPDDIRAEYVDGVAILMPPGTWDHQSVELNLAVAVRSGLTDVVVAAEAGVRTAGRKYRIGDVVVMPAGAMPEGQFAETPPLVVVEVLSPSTRSEDTVRKSHEYAAAGVGQYWLVDRDEPSLVVYRNTGEGWDLELTLDAERPVGSVVVGDHGTVGLDLNSIIGR